jgi:hypothetical protein
MAKACSQFGPDTLQLEPILAYNIPPYNGELARGQPRGSAASTRFNNPLKQDQGGRSTATQCDTH